MDTTLRQSLGLNVGTAPSHPSLMETRHRPWPVPRGPWIGRQSWHDLLFAHWPVAASALRSFVPHGLEVEEKDGTSWVSVVCFRLNDLSLRSLPELPWVGRFLELNVRLYVQKEGKPGVWFLSLDASSSLAVAAARTLVNLPYVRANMSLTPADGGFRFESQRRRGEPARFHAQYSPVGEMWEPSPGSLAHFLAERYCLYTRLPNGRLARLQIHHLPWPLQDATATVDANELFAAHGLPITGPPALVQFSECQDVILWPPELTGK
jgi:uncharacterized protein YqjF (DUF2071 family)